MGRIIPRRFGFCTAKTELRIRNLSSTIIPPIYLRSATVECRGFPLLHSIYVDSRTDVVPSRDQQYNLLDENFHGPRTEVNPIPERPSLRHGAGDQRSLSAPLLLQSAAL